MSVPAATGHRISLEHVYARQGVRTLAIHVVICSTILLNFVICALRTRGLPVGSDAVALGEITIYAMALYLARQEIPLVAVAVAIASVVYVLGMQAIVNPGIDPKILRDIAIPFIFFAFGRACGNLEQADQVVYWAVEIVTIGALFEASFPGYYTRVVDVLTFYYERGGMSSVGFDQMTRNIPGNHLYTSGFRTADEGRWVGSYLSGLIGNHRVSSVFLEPVSAASFGAIAFSWMVHRFGRRAMVNIIFMCFAALVIVLADGRLAAVTCFTALVLCRFRLSLNSIGIFALPFVALTLLLMDAAYPISTLDDSISGRLLMSGSLLASWGPEEWLAMEISDVAPVDCGYGWLLMNVGLLPLVALWSLFAFHGRLEPRERQWLTIVALYIVLALCIGPAALSVKTAGLLWFLCGAEIGSSRRIS